MNDNANVTRAEFEKMERQVSETAAQVHDLHKALFESPMEGGESLIRRMKTVTEEIETGKRGVRLFLWFLGAMAALGVSIKVGMNGGAP